MRFKVGDRVRVFGGSIYALEGRAPSETGYKGTVKYIQDGWLSVELDNPNKSNDQYLFHPKQCRKLKKKARRRIWLPSSHLERVLDAGCGLIDIYNKAYESCTEFVEVKSK